MATRNEYRALRNRLAALALSNCEPVTSFDASRVAEELNLENLKSYYLSAELARANAYAVGELIANEHETPDSDIMTKPGGKTAGEIRRERITHWQSLFYNYHLFTRA